ncbi:MAG: hypothetical protein ACTSRS_18800, partial [Candidatus Helarchaeota archaeon]
QSDARPHRGEPHLPRRPVLLDLLAGRAGTERERLPRNPLPELLLNRWGHRWVPRGGDAPVPRGPAEQYGRSGVRRWGDPVLGVLELFVGNACRELHLSIHPRPNNYYIRRL